MADDNDDGLSWGYVTAEGDWLVLPKGPMLLAGMGPPPFDVTLPSGEVRHIVHQPITAGALVRFTKYPTAPSDSIRGMIIPTYYLNQTGHVKTIDETTGLLHVSFSDKTEAWLARENVELL